MAGVDETHDRAGQVENPVGFDVSGQPGVTKSLAIHTFSVPLSISHQT
jgi:hypothetical protein